MLVFWIVTPCGLLVETNVSEQHTASIYKAKTFFFLQVHVPL
jgi:hypothetical protein